MARTDDLDDPCLDLMPFGEIDCRDYELAMMCVAKVFDDKTEIIAAGVNAAKEHAPNVSIRACLNANPYSSVFSPLKTRAFYLGYIVTAKHLRASPLKSRDVDELTESELISEYHRLHRGIRNTGDFDTMMKLDELLEEMRSRGIDPKDIG